MLKRCWHYWYKQATADLSHSGESGSGGICPSFSLPDLRLASGQGDTTQTSPRSKGALPALLLEVAPAAIGERTQDPF